MLTLLRPQVRRADVLLRPTVGPALALALSLTPACSGNSVLSLEVPAGAQSLIVGISEPGGLVVTAYALVDQPLIRLSQPRAQTAELTALFYAAPLAAMEIPPGPLASLAGGRTLPKADQIFGAEIRAGGVIDWAPRDHLDPPLSTFAFAGLSWAACVEAGGCGAGSGDATYCQNPCPVPAPPAAPTPPAPPAPPRFTPCPTGWTETSSGTLVLCEPEADRHCSAGEAQFLADASCAPLGDPCPAGEWADNLASLGRPVSFVRASSAAPGGSGTASDPFRRIEDAILAAPPGGVIAIGRGRFAEGLLQLSKPLSLIGACAASSIIVGDGSDRVIAVSSSGVELRNLAIRGGGIGVYVGVSGADASLDGIEISQTSEAGLQVEYGSARARGLVIQDVAGSYAIWVLSGALELERTIVERSANVAAISASRPGCSLRFRDLWLRGSRSAWGLVIDSGSLSGQELVIEGPQGVGLQATSDAVVTIGDAIVRDVGRNMNGIGLAVDNASVTVSRARFERIAGTGIHVDAQTATSARRRVALNDLLVSGSPIAEYGHGGIEASIHRARFESFADSGVEFWGPGPLIDLQDLSLDGAAATLDRSAGIFADESSFAGQRIEIARLPKGHALEFGPSVSATISDVSVVGGAFGILSNGSVRLRLDRAAFDGLSFEGMRFNDALSVSMRDLAIRNPAGLGLNLSGTASVTLIRVLVEGSSGIGIEVFNARASARELTVKNAHGAGLSLCNLARVAVDGFLLDGNSSFGAELIPGAELDLHRGKIANNSIGVDAPSGYDLRRVIDGVVFEGNRSNFSAP